MSIIDGSTPGARIHQLSYQRVSRCIGTFVKAGQPVPRVQIWKGDADNVPVVPHGKVVAAYPRGHRQQVNVTARLPKTLVAPIK